LLDLGAVEVGGEVGNELLGDEEIVTGKQNFVQNIAIVDAVYKNSYL